MVSVLLNIPVEFGLSGFTGQFHEVKYAGCEKGINVN
jgi:hypothetical protein